MCVCACVCVCVCVGRFIYTYWDRGIHANAHPHTHIHVRAYLTNFLQTQEWLTVDPSVTVTHTMADAGKAGLAALSAQFPAAVYGSCFYHLV